MYYVVLGLVQGLTEFLPVSSSGHLVIGQYLLHITIPGVAFEAFVHLGTSLAVIAVFREEIKALICSFLRSISRLCSGENFVKTMQEDSHCKFAWFLLISTIPGALIGYFLEEFFENLFSSPVITSIMLLTTGLCLFFTDRVLIDGRRKLLEMKATDALLIGLAQALAIIPGLSRSGFTVMMGLNLKLEREFAAKYSFILSVPIILGASIYKMPELFHMNIRFNLLLMTGMTAFLTGYWAIKIFTKMLVNFKLYVFSYYLWMIGLSVLLLHVIYGK